ncbi:MAG: InlB B-repeat-containing protein, partial [Alphaproteobacteria bacterium]|nr:InlB B-repeat-containing protein [Alphaproteobacteria bacterium]
MSVFRGFLRVCCLAIFSSVLCCSSVFLNAAYGVEISFGGGDSNNNGYGTPATGSYGPLSYATGTTVVFPNNAFTISGYVISGWICQNKDDGATFPVTYTSSNNTFSLTAPDTRAFTCTAQWTQCSCTEGVDVLNCVPSVNNNNQCVYTWSCGHSDAYAPSVTPPYTLTSGTSYTANCEPIDYGIFYLNMGSSDIPSGVTLPNTYNVESSTITIPALTPSQRPHETFVGWCEWDSVNNTYNPNTCSLNPTIPAGSIGHKYYYARWNCDTGYTTSFNVANNYGASGLEILNNGTSASVSGDVWTVVFGDDDPEITLSGIGMCSDANSGYYPYQFVTTQELNDAYVNGYKDMCWCKLSGYSYDGENQNLSTDFWVYNGGTSYCTQASCQAKCLSDTRDQADQREQLLFASNVCEPNRYHITYNEGSHGSAVVSGMPVTNPEIVYYGDTYTLASAPSATGYTFTGWSCPNLPHATVQQNGYYAAGTTPDINSNTNQPYGYDYLGDVTCTAQWERITHRITFKTG